MSVQLKNTLTPLLKKAHAKMRPAIRRGFERWVKETRDLMWQRAPKDTGTLANSIKWKWNGDDLELFQDSSEADYGIFLEFGTYKMKAQPFFFPILDERKDILTKYINEELDKILK